MNTSGSNLSWNGQPIAEFNCSACGASFLGNFHSCAPFLAERIKWLEAEVKELKRALEAIRPNESEAQNAKS